MSKKKEKGADYQIQDIAEYLQQLHKGRYYSIQRFDILIVLLATSGIYFIATSSGLESQRGSCSFSFAIVLFVISIVVNLISQWLGYLANNACIKLYQKQYVEIRSTGKIDRDKYKPELQSDKQRTKTVHFLNALSLFSLLLAIVFATVVTLS